MFVVGPGQIWLGAISFNRQNKKVCLTSNYKVETNLSSDQSPNKPNPKVNWNHCKIQDFSMPTFHWTYSDNDSQAAYEIKIYGKTILDETINCSFLPCLSYALNPDWVRNNLNWAETYNWQVRVKDNQGNWSEWSNLDSFTMPPHVCPWPDFSWLPIRHSVGEISNLLVNQPLMKV